MKRALVFLLRCYQYGISPLLGPHCRFYPACSSYSIEAIEKHGAVRGFWLSVRRVARCHPWHDGGMDLVPERPKPIIKQS